MVIFEDKDSPGLEVNTWGSGLFLQGDGRFNPPTSPLKYSPGDKHLGMGDPGDGGPWEYRNRFYGIPALPGSSPNHTASSLLSNTTPVFHMHDYLKYWCSEIITYPDQLTVGRI